VCRNFYAVHEVCVLGINIGLSRLENKFRNKWAIFPYFIKETELKENTLRVVEITTAYKKTKRLSKA
jgi:hypothetical protein